MSDPAAPDAFTAYRILATAVAQGDAFALDVVDGELKPPAVALAALHA